jgi:O-antigen/teichoic acid export membrane protein
VLALLIILSLPVMTSIIILAAPISHLLYGTKAFVDMPLVLQISALAIMPMYLVTTMYQFLVAQNRGRASGQDFSLPVSPVRTFRQFPRSLHSEALS